MGSFTSHPRRNHAGKKQPAARIYNHYADSVLRTFVEVLFVFFCFLK